MSEIHDFNSADPEGKTEKRRTPGLVIKAKLLYNKLSTIIRKRGVSKLGKE